MAGAIMDKVWGLFGGVDQGETEEYDDDAYEYEDKSNNYENEEDDDKKFFGEERKSCTIKCTRTICKNGNISTNNI